MKQKLISFAVILVLILALLVVWAREPLPQGAAGPDADALAHRMLQAVKADAWQATGAVAWTFRGDRRHLWDRERQFARVSWDQYEVWLDLEDRQGYAKQAGQELTGTPLAAALTAAYAAWCNDAFWLNPVAKIFDPGTQRQIVETQKGTALLVHFTAGGMTPGDSYLFRLGDDGLPIRWKMWTQILPIKGLATGFENWTPLATGALIATEHPIGPTSIRLEEVRAAKNLAELEPGPDPFERLAARRRAR